MCDIMGIAVMDDTIIILYGMSEVEIVNSVLPHHSHVILNQPTAVANLTRKPTIS
jgi:hypothetical protein